MTDKQHTTVSADAATLAGAASTEALLASMARRLAALEAQQVTTITLPVALVNPQGETVGRITLDGQGRAIMELNGEYVACDKEGFAQVAVRSSEDEGGSVVVYD